MSVQKQRGFRERNPDKPVLGLLADRYAKWYLEFSPTGEASRSELAEEFFENSREAAEDYVEMERCSRPDVWNDWTRDPESRYWMHKHKDERKAWAYAIDLIWQFSDGENDDLYNNSETLCFITPRTCHDHAEDLGKLCLSVGILREKV